MPRFDGTGPTGTGSQTGKIRGKCRNPKDDSAEDAFTPPFSMRGRRGGGQKCLNNQTSKGQGQGRNKGIL